MAPQKRTRYQECAQLAKFLSRIYLHELQIKGWSPESPFGYASAEIFRTRDKKTIQRLAYIWRNNICNVQRRCRDLKNTTNIDATSSSVASLKEHGDVTEQTREPAVLKAPAASVNSTKYQLQVEPEMNTQYAIFHAPVTVHQQTKATREHDKEKQSCGSCLIKFGLKPHAFQCSICNTWFHKKNAAFLIIRQQKRRQSS
jgi:hypothetical protein